MHHEKLLLDGPPLSATKPEEGQGQQSKEFVLGECSA